MLMILILLCFVVPMTMYCRRQLLANLREARNTPGGGRYAKEQRTDRAKNPDRR